MDGGVGESRRDFYHDTADLVSCTVHPVRNPLYLKLKRWTYSRPYLLMRTREVRVKGDFWAWEI
jgi:hypothetical protein